MPWPFKDNNQSTPEELKDLTAEQMVAKVKKLAELELEIGELKNKGSQTETEKDSLNGQIILLQQQIEELKRVAAPPPQKQLFTDFLDNQDQAFAERVAPLAQAQMITNARLARMDAQNIIRRDLVDSRLLDRFESEIDKMFNTVPLNYQGDPQTYVGCFERVVGQKRRDLSSEHGTERDVFTERGNNNRPTEDKPSKDVLTTEEQRVASKLGVKPDAYIKYRNSMFVDK